MPSFGVTHTMTDAAAADTAPDAAVAHTSSDEVALAMVPADVVVLAMVSADEVVLAMVPSYEVVLAMVPALLCLCIPHMTGCIFASLLRNCCTNFRKVRLQRRGRRLPFRRPSVPNLHHRGTLPLSLSCHL